MYLASSHETHQMVELVVVQEQLNQMHLKKLTHYNNSWI